METPEDSKAETKNSDGIQARNYDYYYYWNQTRNWLREKADQSNLTDWIIGLFTVVLSVVAMLQSCLISRQAKIMSMDERAWLAVKFVLADEKGKNQVTIEPVIIESCII